MDLRFPTAVQIVLSLALSERRQTRCTSRMLADGLGTNPSFVRQLLAPLTAEGLVRASAGKGGGLYLAQPAQSITLADIYRISTGAKHLLEGRRDLPGAGSCVICSHMESFFETVSSEVEQAALRRLEQRTIAACLDEILLMADRAAASDDPGASCATVVPGMRGLLSE